MKGNKKHLVFGVCVAFVLLGAFAGVASATTWYVEEGESIQAAVDEASAGDTIVVRDGTYMENLYITKSNLTLRTENGADKTIVTSAESGIDVFVIKGNYITIRGFTITGAETLVKETQKGKGSISLPKGGIFIDTAGHIRISDNLITLNADYGIKLDDAYNITIDDNIISNSGTGIIIFTESTMSHANNKIINNIITSNEKSGVELVSSGNLIINNSITNNGIGIELVYSSYNIITKNNINSNKNGAGLYSSYSSPGHIVHANVIYLNNFINNDFTFDPHSTPNSSCNTWTNLSFDLGRPVMMTYAYNGKIYTNYLGNYWSDYKGDDTNNDGIGDSPYKIEVDRNRDNYPLMKPFENYITEIEPTTEIPTKTSKEKPTIPSGEEKGIPGFEVAFAIAGLLLAVYIFRRWKK